MSPGVKPEAEAQDGNKGNWLDRTKRFVGGLLILAIVGIGGYKTYDDFKNKSDFEAIYAKVVRKLLVYSIVSQISGEQDRLVVNQSAVMGYGGGEFSLECGAGFFSGRDRLEPGGIFSCWNREVERTENSAANLVAQDDEQIGAALVPARYNLGEITFSFDLYTVFGKTAEIYVNKQSNFAEKIEGKFCDSANGIDQAKLVVCDIRMYTVSATYKQPDDKVAKVDFVLIPRVPQTNESGDFYLSDEWRVYLDDGALIENVFDSGLKVSRITSDIRQSLDRAGVFNADIATIGPQLEERWQKRDREFFERIESNLKGVQGQLEK